MQKLADILKKFPEKKVVVIGDVMLDQDICGHVSRVSPEEESAPVLEVDNDVFVLGGAANVASNISSLKGAVSVFGFVGNDKAGRIMKNLFEEKGIAYYLGENSITTLKIRPKGKTRQIMRIDYEDCSKKIFSPELKEKMQKEIHSSDIILISDYAKGAITKDLMNFLKEYSSKTVVNPKPENKYLYKNVFLIIPNKKEALEMSNKKDFLSAGRCLKKNLNSNVLITLAEKGIMLFSDRELEIPTQAKEIYDVTGAGDTVASTIALSLASGSSLEEAAILANHAAGIAVSKYGTYNVKLNELERVISGEEGKLKTFSELVDIVNDLKRKGKTIIWTNGCFDILHEGHINYLKKAKEFGNYLVIGLNSDESVKIIKGKDRPIRPEQARAEILSALQFVDYVMIFPETSVEKYLDKLQPQIYVKAGDYDIKKMNQKERKAIESYNGKIIFILIESNISTTKIIESIKNEK